MTTAVQDAGLPLIITRENREGRRKGRKRAIDARDENYLAAEHVPGVAAPLADIAEDVKWMASARGIKAIEGAASPLVRQAIRSGVIVPAWAADLPMLSRYLPRGPQLNQGQSSRCTIFANAHAIGSGAIMQRYEIIVRVVQALERGGAPDLDAALWLLYEWAQDNDEWPGSERDPNPALQYGGTSERAAAQAFRLCGFWDHFYHLKSVEECARYLILTGNGIPFGSDWTADMDEPDSRGFIRPTGAWLGGHEYHIDGVNILMEKFRIRNSWGPQWWRDLKGNWQGGAWLSFADARTLFGWGVGAIAVKEVRLPTAAAIAVKEVRLPTAA